MKPKILSLFSILLACVILAQFWLMGTASIATALPPRPTAVPTPKSQKLRGSIIELHVEGELVEDMWTVVQWQDAPGNWHDVTGWQGTLDEANVKTWWVGKEDLDTGPFRWVVMADGEVLGISGAFYLPAQPGEKVVVIVTVESTPRNFLKQ